jgi:hypothetical protein
VIVVAGLSAHHYRAEDAVAEAYPTPLASEVRDSLDPSDFDHDRCFDKLGT